MDEKIITLPNREEMLERLKKVSDDSYMQERFYPILLKFAGQEYSAKSVVMMFVRAIHNCIKEGMPPFVASTTICMEAPKMIDALVDDSEVANQAKTFLRETLSAKK